MVRLSVCNFSIMRCEFTYILLDFPTRRRRNGCPGSRLPSFESRNGKSLVYRGGVDS